MDGDHAGNILQQDYCKPTKNNYCDVNVSDMPLDYVPDGYISFKALAVNRCYMTGVYTNMVSFKVKNSCDAPPPQTDTETTTEVITTTVIDPIAPDVPDVPVPGVDDVEEI